MLKVSTLGTSQMGSQGIWKTAITIHPGNFYKLIPLPVFFVIFFVIFTGIRCGTDFFL